MLILYQTRYDCFQQLKASLLDIITQDIEIPRYIFSRQAFKKIASQDYSRWLSIFVFMGFFQRSSQILHCLPLALLCRVLYYADWPTLQLPHSLFQPIVISLCHVHNFIST